MSKLWSKYEKWSKQENRAFPVPRTKQWLTHGPTLSKFLGHLESEFDDFYFYRFDFLEVYFNQQLESLKSDQK